MPGKVAIFGPDLIKINEWELARFVDGPVDGEARMRAAAE